MLIAAILIKIEEPNAPILFRQQRPGKDEKIFTIYKFRTMKAQLYDLDGNPLSDMERMTKVGNILRKTSIDEFPQFINVLMGDMSFIGPRPLLTQYLNHYNEIQRRRHSVRPGISG
ncbi:sugar transferase, partial [Turicibacter bilis]|uniref:sugar transferase n=1 Tax=Turicibacter bilis TaxID=2735723 RepID=UPI0031BAD147